VEPIDIIHELKKRGKSQTQLARDLDISNSVVNNVIHGKVTSHTVAQYIATFLGKQLNEIWPGQYVYKPRNRPKKIVNNQIKANSGANHDLTKSQPTK
jgi:lambda repressor-like predicted transcriptional regulator